MGGIGWKRKRAQPAAHLWVAPGSHRFAKKGDPSRLYSCPEPLRRVRERMRSREFGSGYQRAGVPRTRPLLPQGARAPDPPQPRPASRTSIPRPLPRPRARGSGRAQAREPRCAWARAGRRPQAASGGWRGPAGGGCPGARPRHPASEPRPRPAACPAASLAEAGQVRAAAHASRSAGPSGQRHPVARGAHCARPRTAGKQEVLKVGGLQSPELITLPKFGPHAASVDTWPSALKCAR